LDNEKITFSDMYSAMIKKNGHLIKNPLKRKIDDINANTKHPGTKCRQDENPFLFCATRIL